MKALVQIVTCTGDHVKFVIVPVVRFEGEVDDWATCNDNPVCPFEVAGIVRDRCEQCGDTDRRAEYVCCVLDDISADYAGRIWDSVREAYATDEYGRPYDKHGARRELERRIGCDDDDDGVSVVPVAMVDGERLAGKVIRHKSIGADYLLLRVGLDKSNTSHWQAFAVDQMTHRLWAMPKTTTEVEHEFRIGSIEFAG